MYYDDDDYEIGSLGFYHQVLAYNPLPRPETRRYADNHPIQNDWTSPQSNLNQLLEVYNYIQQQQHSNYVEEQNPLQAEFQLYELMNDYCQQFEDYPLRQVSTTVTAPLSSVEVNTVDAQLARIVPDKYASLDITFGDFSGDPTIAEDLDFELFEQLYDTLITHSALECLLNGKESKYFKALDVKMSGPSDVTAEARRMIGMRRIFERLDPLLRAELLVVIDVPKHILDNCEVDTHVQELCFGSVDIELIDGPQFALSHLIDSRRLVSPSHVARIYTRSEFIAFPPEQTHVRVIMTKDEFLSFKNRELVIGLNLRWFVASRLTLGQYWKDSG